MIASPAATPAATPADIDLVLSAIALDEASGTCR